MKFEIKKLKKASFVIDESAPFQCEIHTSGKCVAQASNSGHGGPDCIDWIDKKAEAVFNTQAATLFPEYKSAPQEMLVGHLLRELDIRKSITRWTKTKTVFLLKGDDVIKGWRTIARAYDPVIKAHLDNTYGDKLFICANVDIEAAVAYENAAQAAQDNKSMSDMFGGYPSPALVVKVDAKVKAKAAAKAGA